MRHISVLQEEAIASLNLAAGKRIVDATLGDAGHAEKIAKQIGKRGKLLGIDADPEAILRSQKFLEPVKDRVILVRESFAHLAQIVEDNNFAPVDGVLFDLGWSTPQFMHRGRGFSFMQDEPLNMRFDGKTNGVVTAASLLQSSSVQELTLMFSRYGEEPRARTIANAIVNARKTKAITISGQLVQIVETVYGGKRGKIHPATKVFQALRIAVNDEFEVLKQGLVGAVSVLKPGGRLVVISFHSGEDRIVKRFMQTHPELSVLTKKPIIAGENEIKTNSKARSAKLRVVEKQEQICDSHLLSKR